MSVPADPGANPNAAAPQPLRAILDGIDRLGRLDGWIGAGCLVALTTLPWFVAFAPGLVLAVLVLWDPTGLFAARPAKGRRITPINEFAATLDRHLDKRVEQWPVVETKRS